MPHWKKKSELAKVLKRYDLSQRRLRNLRRACRNSGWPVEVIRAIEACRAADFLDFYLKSKNHIRPQGNLSSLARRKVKP
jgi:hypothetical protein